MDKNRLLSRDEVAEIYGISKRFLETAAMRDASPPAVRLGHRTVRYRVADIEAWIEAQTGTTTDRSGSG
ncbi:helix-turn-helix transcriptional regulator [Vannielia litorea]|uniref:Transcriptional regulator, AlpA family n=1 Tax=Vannielia litorea TaxID=1217970 RepID=A0A1N6GIL7_9RHOB|nr:helix-turn-helix domain-containing protein [Vannielia litorea]SIO07311.1 transcriptional regulator, AlpA family [Vannielia litorea]